MKRARLRRLPPPPRIRKSLLRERNAGDLAPLRLAVGVLWELRQHDHAAARSKRIGRRSSSHHRAVILHQGDLAHLRALRSPLFSEVARRVTNLFAPPTMIDAGPLAGAHPCKVRRWASTKEILKSDAYENRTKSAKCGGSETNEPRQSLGSQPVCAVRRFVCEAAVIGDFSAAKSSRNFWSRKDWRRERNWDPTFST